MELPFALVRRWTDVTCNGTVVSCAGSSGLEEL